MKQLLTTVEPFFRATIMRYAFLQAAGELTNSATSSLFSRMVSKPRRHKIINGELYVETGHDRLHCYRIGTDVKLRWTLPLGNSPLAGSPRVFNDRLVIARRNGEVWAVNPADGVIASRRHKISGPGQWRSVDQDSGAKCSQKNQDVEMKRCHSAM